ncbi:MAG: LytTR family transcriptional regulator DNA-binding domain-containing protein [Cyclobacteriaceae bacterium]
MLFQILQKEFDILDDRHHRIWLVIITGCYAVAFMNLYVPFNVQDWMPKGDLPDAFYLTSFGLVGATFLACSQLIVREQLTITPFKRYHFILWTLGELVLLSTLMLLLFGETHLGGTELLFEYLLTMKQTLLVGAIPYATVVLYLQARNSAVKTPGTLLVSVPDETGDIQMNIELDHLLYLKAADNYVEVFIWKDDVVSKELIRNNLKRLEVSWTDLPVKRCHRSFMINMQKVSMTTKVSNGLSVYLRGVIDPIPVSKNYIKLFELTGDGD